MILKSISAVVTITVGVLTYAGVAAWLVAAAFWNWEPANPSALALLLSLGFITTSLLAFNHLESSDEWGST